jgi:ABC-2 type transport system ATP-binding protein
MYEVSLNHTDSMIVTQGLSKRFGKVLAVDRLTISVAPGEVFGLLGPNGAGKTTTIRMLGALIGPSEGEAWVAGYQVGRQDDDIRRNVGILTEAPGLYEQLSAERNLAFYGVMYEVQDIPSQVERYLRMLGLWERRHELVGTFSKGMRQKLAIARALLHEPKVLFLDEPTSGLDPEMARLVREFISDLRREGRTIVLCTHNLDEADRLCDRVAVLNTRLLALDSPAALRRQLFGRAVVFHLRSVLPEYVALVEGFPFVHAVRLVENKLVVTLDEPEEQNPQIIQALVDAGAEIQFVGELRHRLEDVYLRLMAQRRETA